MSEETGPRNKSADERQKPESIDGKRPAADNAPADRKDETPINTPSPGNNDTRREPVTNQDEQDKITNAESSDLPVADK